MADAAMGHASNAELDALWASVTAARPQETAPPHGRHPAAVRIGVPAGAASFIIPRIIKKVTNADDKRMRTLPEDGTWVPKDVLPEGDTRFGPEWQAEELDHRTIIESDPNFKFLTLVAGAANTTVSRLYDEDSVGRKLREVVNERALAAAGEAAAMTLRDLRDERDEMFARKGPADTDAKALGDILESGVFTAAEDHRRAVERYILAVRARKLNVARNAVVVAALPLSTEVELDESVRTVLVAGLPAHNYTPADGGRPLSTDDAAKLSADIATHGTAFAEIAHTALAEALQSEWYSSGDKMADVVTVLKRYIVLLHTPLEATAAPKDTARDPRRRAEPDVPPLNVSRTARDLDADDDRVQAERRAIAPMSWYEEAVAAAGVLTSALPVARSPVPHVTLARRDVATYNDEKNVINATSIAYSIGNFLVGGGTAENRALIARSIAALEETVAAVDAGDYTYADRLRLLSISQDAVAEDPLMRTYDMSVPDGEAGHVSDSAAQWGNAIVWFSQYGTTLFADTLFPVDTRDMHLEPVRDQFVDWATAIRATYAAVTTAMLERIAPGAPPPGFTDTEKRMFRAVRGADLDVVAQFGLVSNTAAAAAEATPLFAIVGSAHAALIKLDSEYTERGLEFERTLRAIDDRIGRMVRGEAAVPRVPRLPYEHRRGWVELPEHSGVVHMLEIVVSGISSAWNRLCRVAPNVTDVVDIKFAQHDAHMRADFAELVAIEMAIAAQRFPKRYIQLGQRAHTMTDLASVLARFQHNYDLSGVHPPPRAPLARSVRDAIRSRGGAARIAPTAAPRRGVLLL